MDKILIIGAGGQLGKELTLTLRELAGVDNVVATDINPAPDALNNGIYETLDVLDNNSLFSIIKKYNINQIYNLAAVLSATGEKNPKLAWKLNMDGLINVLDAAKELGLSKVYWPSSIAVFGPDTPAIAPQVTIMNPNTVYGISKLAGERWCSYYHLKYGVDVRSLRYPGLIGYKSMPGGGTTDFAVDIYYQAIAKKTFKCFLSAETSLPLMYMPDAISATIGIMNADAKNLSIHDSYNVAGFSCSPEEIAESIKKIIPDFEIEYQPDYRQAIADSWPDAIDDAKAREEWKWERKYALDTMTKDMLKNLEKIKS